MQSKISVILIHLFPRIQDALFIGILLAVSRQGASLLNADGDLGRHITIGNYIRNTWKIPMRDVFSHTMAGQRLVPHEWLSQLTLAEFHAWSGLDGVVLLIAVLIAATFMLTYREMLRRNTSRLLAFLITVLAAYASSLHWLARPHIFTFLFAAIWAYQLEHNRSKVWLFPLIMWVWANTHGAFIAGFVIWGAHMAGWLWEYLQKKSKKETGVRLAIIGATSFAITLLNPAGWHLWDASLGYLGNQFLVDQTIEYQSPNFHYPSTWPFLIMLALGILGFGLEGRLRPHETFLFAGWTIMSLYSARNIPLFAIVAAPYVATMLQATLDKMALFQRVDQLISGLENNLKGGAWPGAVAILILAVLWHGQPNPDNRFDSSRFPVQAVDWISTHPQEGRMFNSFIWGGYLLYRLWPQELVFIDGQTDFYGETLSRQYIRVMHLEEGWETVLAEYGVSWVILPSGGPVVQALQDQMGWIVIYHDKTAVILRKPQTIGSSLITPSFPQEQPASYNTASIMIASKMNTR